MKNYIKIAVLAFLILNISAVSISSFCYADDNYPSIGGGGGRGWTNISNEEELVAAFKAYCRSRNFDISHEPNTVKAIVNYDYDQLQKFAELANIDLTTLNAHIWYTYDNNGLLKWYIDSIALSNLSACYGAIVNENNINDNSQTTLYSGEYFADSDGNGAYVFYTSSVGSGVPISKKGTFYKYVSKQIYYEMVTEDVTSKTYNFNIHNTNYSLNCLLNNNINNYGGKLISFNNNSNYWLYIDGRYDTYNTYTCYQSYVCILKNTSTGNYYLGSYLNWKRVHSLRNETFYENKGYTGPQITLPDVTNANIQANQGEPTTEPSNKALEVQTQDTSINNYITNNNITNNTYNYSDDDNPPSSKPDPLPPTDTFPTNGDNNNPNNWTMPNIGIDWNLDFNDFPEIFPFSIPFDFIHIFQLLDADPVAPEYHIECDIANVHIDEDINFEWADEYMGWFRNIVLTGYIIFLIIATRGIFKIY